MTDGYLLALATRRDGVLASFDTGVAELLEDKTRQTESLENPQPLLRTLTDCPDRDFRRRVSGSRCSRSCKARCTDSMRGRPRRGGR